MTSLYLLAAHLLGDFITQTGWMAMHKLQRADVRALHVTVYTLGFIPFLLMAGMAWLPMAGFLAVLWVTHFITDCRRWASGEQWPPKPIVVDQAIHIITLAVMGWAFGL